MGGWGDGWVGWGADSCALAAGGWFRALSRPKGQKGPGVLWSAPAGPGRPRLGLRGGFGRSQGALRRSRGRKIVFVRFCGWSGPSRWFRALSWPAGALSKVWFSAILQPTLCTELVLDGRVDRSSPEFGGVSPEFPGVWFPMHGVARSSPELPGVTRSSPELPGVARSCTELHGVARSCN